MNAPTHIYTISGLLDITPDKGLLKPEYVFEDENVNWDQFNMWLYEKELLRISEPIIQDVLAKLPAPHSCFYHTGSVQFAEEQGATVLQFGVVVSTYMTEAEFNDYLQEALAPIIKDEFGPAYEALEQMAYNHLPDEFCRPVEVRYRTESFSGLQERDAAEVMAYETFEMGNADILECMRDSYLSGRPICEKIDGFIRELEDNGFVDDMFWEQKVDFFREVLKEISEVTGIEVNTALWLADKDTVLNFYGRNMVDENDIDAYETGPVILSDLGLDGTLYGYTNLPEPLTKRDVERLSNTSREEVGKPSLASQIQSAQARTPARDFEGNPLQKIPGR